MTKCPAQGAKHRSPTSVNPTFTLSVCLDGLECAGFECYLQTEYEDENDEVCPRMECFAIVGDGWMKGHEACEDGNIVSGDGCSSMGVLECCFFVLLRKDDSGVETTYLPLITSVCGDGCLAGVEVRISLDAVCSPCSLYQPTGIRVHAWIYHGPRTDMMVWPGV